MAKSIEQQRIDEGRQLPQNSSKVPMPKVNPPRPDAPKAQSPRPRASRAGSR